MKALVLRAYNSLIVEEVERPVPRPGEVLVRVMSSAICGSDIHGIDGSTGRRIPPIIMGHEASGEIAELGDEVSGWEKGDRVTFDSTIFQLDDWFTRRGWYNLSEGRRVLGVSCENYRQNGTFAEFVAVPQHILYRLPDTLSYDAAAITEPLAVAMHAVSLTPLAQGDTVAVIGAGMIGLMAIASLAHSGCTNIVASDVSLNRLELARKCGATHIVNPAETSLEDMCRSLTEGRGADAVLEAVGTELTLRNAIDSVRRGGTVTAIGNISKEATIPIQKLVTSQIRLQGSCSIREEFPAALALLNSDRIPVDLIISESGTLADAPHLFERLVNGDPDLIRVVLHPQE